MPASTSQSNPTGRPARDLRLPSETTDDGAFMEQRGRNRWQSVASRKLRETAQTSQNHCRGLRLVADRNLTLPGSARFEAVAQPCCTHLDAGERGWRLRRS